jgi:uncharacterized protein with PQ loop repeat
MTFGQLQLLAGSFSSLIFVSSNFPMLWKVLKTRDVKSYSLGQIILRNLGNLVYWIYIASLPVGPAWYLQGFFTCSGLVLLACYLKFDAKCYPFRFANAKSNYLSHYMEFLKAGDRISKLVRRLGARNLQVFHAHESRYD